LTTLLWDIRYALRTLRQNPAVTAVAALALALGIGANTAIFSVVNAVLLSPLPYADPSRLVTLLGPRSHPLSPPDFIDIRNQSKSFEGVAAGESWTGNLSGRSIPEQIVGLHLSEDMFRILGVPALRGRTFSRDDFQARHGRVLVISYGLWQRRFGGAADAIGQTVVLDGEPYNLIGVMPASFQFTPFWITQVEMWAPLDVSDRLTQRGFNSLRLFARLRPGVSLVTAQAEVDGICRNLARAYPDTNTNMQVLVEQLQEKVVGNVRPALLVILGAVGLVLLIACANVANLVLARATARRRETAIRLSLGAQPIRIARLFLTESVVLSLVGAMLGLLLAVWGTNALQAFMQPDPGAMNVRLARWDTVAINAPVLGFTLLLSLATGILFGLAPALFASRQDLNERLKEGGRSLAGGRGSGFRKALVTSEVAIAIVLLVGSGLLMRSFLNLREINPGFDPSNLLTMTVSVAGQQQYVGPQREQLYRTLVMSLQGLPGVRSVAMTNHLPLVGDTWGTNMAIEGRPIPLPGHEMNTVYREAGPNYFATMRIPLRNGREFSERDNLNSPLVAIINETLAKTAWPHEDPIGKRITLEARQPRWRTIIGVTRDVKQSNWTGPLDNEVYIPFLQDARFLTSQTPWQAYVSIIIRTDTDAAALAPAVQQTIWSVDRDMPVSRLQTMQHAIGNALWQSRFNLMLIGIFAAIAMILAVVGIYGVMAYEVAQRTQEIGIRMALGANRGGIVRLVFSQSLLVVLTGVMVGVVAALGLARLMTSMIYQVQPADPLTYLGVTALVFSVAALSALLPARRATRVDPIIALRYE
jgi:putative ABC transport system permease protein